MLKRRRKQYREPVIVTLYRYPSIVTTWLFWKLGFQPNAVSLLAIITAAIGAVLAGFGFMLVGVTLMMLSYVLDRSDGEIARLTNRSTLRGCYLEVLYSNVFYAGLFSGLAIGYYMKTQYVPVLILGFSALAFKLLMRNSDMAKGRLIMSAGRSAETEVVPVRSFFQEAYTFIFTCGGMVLFALIAVILEAEWVVLAFYGLLFPVLFVAQIVVHWMELNEKR